jgi:hypothetical protein
MRKVFYEKALEREKDYVENAEYTLERHKTEEILSKPV